MSTNLIPALIAGKLAGLAGLTTPDQRAHADAIAIAIGRDVEALIAELRVETSESVVLAARALLRADARRAAAETAVVEATKALRDSVALASDETFWPPQLK